MSKDITQLVMERYFINELDSSIKKDTEVLKQRWLNLKTNCNHPMKYRIAADIAYDMDAQYCSLCDTTI